jgi:hypothetical protein
MIILGVHRRVDVAGRHRVEPDVVRRVLHANALLTAGIGDFDSTAKSAGATPLG